MDSQKIEIVERNRLTNELLEAGLEVAEPIRDRGIDLIAYLDIDDEINQFVAFPIQLKANSEARFSVTRKYDRFPNLILAHVSGLGGGGEAVTYAVTQVESIAIAEEMGWTKTVSWEKGYYTAVASVRLRSLLEPYRMTPLAWRQKLLGML